MDYPQVLRVKLILATVAGLDIHFLDVNPPLFTQVVNLESVSYPSYVELGQEFDLNVTLKNLGSGTIASGTVFSEDNLEALGASLELREKEDPEFATNLLNVRIYEAITTFSGYETAYLFRYIILRELIREQYYDYMDFFTGEEQDAGAPNLPGIEMPGQRK